MTFLRTMTAASLLVIVGCAAPKNTSNVLQPSSKIPGDSIVTVAPALREDALKNLKVFSENKFQCSSPSVKNTVSGKIDGQVALDGTGRLHSGYITEQWSVEECGQVHELKLLFGPDGKGGNYIAIGEINK